MKSYGLIGNPLTHSFSKTYFTEKFSAQGLADYQYQNFELASINELANLLKSGANLQGLNVTIPYKEAVLPFLDFEDEAVKRIGACNCIKLNNGKLTGYNTDVVGFQQSLQPVLKPHHAAALVLGSGGASKAVQAALTNLGIGYLIVSRKASKRGISYSDLGEREIKTHSLIINTTPLGMHPNTQKSPDIPYRFLTQDHLLFDLIYNPATTEFLAKGAEYGAKTFNGHQMLVLQAEESWAIWNDPNR